MRQQHIATLQTCLYVYVELELHNTEDIVKKRGPSTNCHIIQHQIDHFIVKFLCMFKMNLPIFVLTFHML